MLTAATMLAVKESERPGLWYEPVQPVQGTATERERHRELPNCLPIENRHAILCVIGSPSQPISYRLLS